MNMFMLVCPDGFKKDVTADTKEAAVLRFSEDTEVQTHVKSHHPELAVKPEGEMRALLSQFVQPVP